MIVQPIFQTPIFIETFPGLTDELGLEEYLEVKTISGWHS